MFWKLDDVIQQISHVLLKEDSYLPPARRWLLPLWWSM